MSANRVAGEGRARGVPKGWQGRAGQEGVHKGWQVRAGREGVPKGWQGRAGREGVPKGFGLFFPCPKGGRGGQGKRECGCALGPRGVTRRG
eukprot:364667-Chlamydomonas_euryale.AAC.1